VVMQSNHDHRDGSSGGVYAAIVTAWLQHAKGATAAACAGVHSSPLHRLAASAQQLLDGRLPVPELAESGSAKAWKLHRQWEGQGGSGHEGQGQWWPSSYQDHMCSPQPHGNGYDRRGATCPQDLGPQPLLQGPKKIFFFFKKRAPLLWPRSYAYPNCLLPICNLLCLPPLTHSLSHLPAMPLCPKLTIPTMPMLSLHPWLTEVAVKLTLRSHFLVPGLTRTICLS
jgi:hypothetical protein